jgi:hypothetical protein
MVIIVVLVGFLFVGMGLWRNTKDTSRYGKAGEAQLITGISMLIVAAMVIGMFTMVYCGNLGILRAQHLVVMVHEQRVAALKVDLAELQRIPAPAFLNADSPIRAVVEALAAAEVKLAESRAVWAQAQVEIEQYKAGPLWFIPKIYGDR